jgi:hypothetical protein
VSLSAVGRGGIGRCFPFLSGSPPARLDFFLRFRLVVGAGSVDRHVGSRWLADWLAGWLAVLVSRLATQREGSLSFVSFYLLLTSWWCSSRGPRRWASFHIFLVGRKTTIGWMDGWTVWILDRLSWREGGTEGWRVVFWDLRRIHIRMCSFVPCGHHGRSCLAPSNGAGNDGKKTTGRKRLRR